MPLARLIALCICVVAPPNLAPAQAAPPTGQEVRQLVNEFRVSYLRTAAILSTGAYALGLSDGIHAGAVLVATLDGTRHPLLLAERVAECFRGWTVAQFGEWLLQHWDRTPEVWADNWPEAARKRIIERLLSSPGTANSCEASDKP